MSVAAWVEESAYGAGLGVRLEEITDESARLRLPFREANSNPGDALHGGCAASLGLIGSHAIARTILGDDKVPFHTASCQVSYLAAAIGEDVVSSSRLLRKGREMIFVETMVETTEGKPISQVSCLVRGRSGAEEPVLQVVQGDDGQADPGPMGPFVGLMPFTKSRELTIEHMVDGRSRIVMPLGSANADLDGGVHEGALLALLDTTGAMASWAQTGPGDFRASTAAMQAQVLAVPPPADLVGYGRVVQRDGDLFWADVDIAEAATGFRYARGTVIYRIVT